MSGRFQELFDRLLLEWRAARQAGEDVFLEWRARKTLCTPRRKDCGYLYDADKDLDVLAILLYLFMNFFVVRAGPEGCGWLSAACLRTKPKVNTVQQSRHFYGLFAWLQHCLFDDRRMKIESSMLSSPEKELTGNSTVEAEQFYGWSLCSRNYQKKGTTVFEGGGGGGMGRAGRVRVCQVNVTRITRKVFEILNFVFGNLSFVFWSPYSTVCSHIEPNAKLGSPNWSLGRKVSRQIDHRGLWYGRQKYFLVANGD